MNGRMLNIWTIAEQLDGHFNEVSFEVIARARALKTKTAKSGMGGVTAVYMGPPLPEEECRRLIGHGSDAAICVEDDRLSACIVNAHAAALADLIDEYRPDIIIASATTYGRSLLPYVSARFYAGLTADCTELELEGESGRLLQTRPAAGGNIMATIRTPVASPQMATVRPHSFDPLPYDGTREGTLNRFAAKDEYFSGRVRFIGAEETAGDRQTLRDAKIIVSGGRGLKKAENFNLVYELADVLGAAVGASREAVDRGWIGYPHQVGLSGKTVTPELYLAIGISGSVQHLAGMRTSERIISIDEDPEARILKVSDLAVQGNLFSVLPALIEKLKSITAEGESRGKQIGMQRGAAQSKKPNGERRKGRR